jgi:hypothetical protein
LAPTKGGAVVRKGMFWKGVEWLGGHEVRGVVEPLPPSDPQILVHQLQVNEVRNEDAGLIDASIGGNPIGIVRPPHSDATQVASYRLRTIPFHGKPLTRDVHVLVVQYHNFSSVRSTCSSDA